MRPTFYKKRKEIYWVDFHNLSPPALGNIQIYTNIQCYCMLHVSFLFVQIQNSLSKQLDIRHLSDTVLFKRVVLLYMFARPLYFGLPCGLAKILHKS